MAFENLKSTGITYLLGRLKTVFLQIKDAVKSVNGELPDEDGDILIRTVPYAENLVSETSQTNYSEFSFRTSGGTSSVEDGSAWLMKINGRSVHEGFVAESITMTVTPTEDSDITATIDRDTLVAYMDESGTVTLVYSTDWSENPSLYGVTVTGTPAAGDVISIVYVKEERGSITVSNPTKFTATGWNLFNYTEGYAKVKKYSTAYGYKISGTYTALKFSTTLTGTKTDITPVDGAFTVPSDGYVWVTGGSSEDTAIWLTWNDWTEEANEGTFAPYVEYEIDLSEVMDEYFPDGLMCVDDTSDEIDLNIGQAISRIERIDYNSTNLAIAKASGRAYEYDEDYIYFVKASPVASSISVDGGYTVSDHGLEYFDSVVPVYAEILYGNNLKNKLERDVVTKSSDVANNLTTTDAGKVLDARQGKVLKEQADDARYWKVGDAVYVGRITAGCAIGSSTVRFEVYTEKEFPESGIKFQHLFDPSSFRKYDGNTVSLTITDANISAEGNHLIITASGSGLSTGTVYNMFLSTSSETPMEVNIIADA